MTVVFLLVVIVVLLYTRQADRDYTLGLVFLIGAFIWLAVKIHLLSILGDLFALGLEHWTEIVMASSAALLLIVPAIMVYLAARVRFDNGTIRRELREPNGRLRTRFKP
jgi:hypothetical protein